MLYPVAFYIVSSVSSDLADSYSCRRLYSHMYVCMYVCVCMCVCVCVCVTGPESQDDSALQKRCRVQEVFSPVSPVRASPMRTARTVTYSIGGRGGEGTYGNPTLGEPCMR